MALMYEVVRFFPYDDLQHAAECFVIEKRRTKCWPKTLHIVLVDKPAGWHSSSVAMEIQTAEVIATKSNTVWIRGFVTVPDENPRKVPAQAVISVFELTGTLCLGSLI